MDKPIDPEHRSIKKVVAVVGRWIATNAASAALGAAIALGVAWAVGQLGSKPAPIPEQLDQVLTDAANQGLRVAYSREIDLRGTGRPARVLVFRPALRQLHKRSDELRVYEELDNRIRLVLTVRPLQQPDRGPHRINFVAAGQFDSTDRREAILTLERTSQESQLLRPVVLTWDVSEQAYTLRGLLRDRPPLQRPRAGTLAFYGWKEYQPIDVPLTGGTTLRRL
jgi:hypothetical protein